MSFAVSIQTQDFDVSQELAALRMGDARVGAVCSFLGTVRERNDGSSVASMELEHYPGMTEKSIAAMMDEAKKRFDIFRIHSGDLKRYFMTQLFVVISTCDKVCLAADFDDGADLDVGKRRTAVDEAQQQRLVAALPLQQAGFTDHFQQRRRGGSRWRVR